MTDVHEEFEFGLSHILGMDMLLNAQTVFFFSSATNDVL
jgi:hypothetical protein